MAAVRAVAYGISWTLWLSAPLVAGDPGAAETLDSLATFGPALAATCSSRTGSPSRAGGPGRGRIVVPLLVAGRERARAAARWAETRTLLAATLLAVLTALPAALVWLSRSRATAWRALLGSLSVPRSRAGPTPSPSPRFRS